MIDYDGKRFRSEAGADGTRSSATYHQDGDLLWGEATGGALRRGTLTGICRPDGTLDFSYSFVMRDGEIVSGRCLSTPEILDDGRIRLREDWVRYGDGASSGVSYLEELGPGDATPSPAGSATTAAR
ncbi:MAG: hypothetical protein ACJ74O_02135 [Frankiaceae bacterium]